MFLFILVTIIAIVLSVLLHMISAQWLLSLWSRNTSLRRWRIAFIIVVFIFVHMIEITIFAVSIGFLVNDGGYGSLTGVDVSDIGSLVYYSAITYTTVGYGDVTPVGDIRLFAAIEALSGMVLVAWTASVIFTVMQRIWREEQMEQAKASAAGD